MHPFIEKMVRQVQQHPPSCISGFRVSQSHAEPWSDWAGWSLACSCGATKGKLLGHPLKQCNPEYDGPPLFVSPLAFLCSSCGKSTELIDTKQYGYNSEIGKPEGQSWDSISRGSGDRQSVPCPECGASEFFRSQRFMPIRTSIRSRMSRSSSRAPKSISIPLIVVAGVRHVAKSRAWLISSWRKRRRGMTPLGLQSAQPDLQSWVQEARIRRNRATVARSAS